jgi:hypothetical protein
MSIFWVVDRNTGSRAFITSLSLRKEVWRPQTMSREDFFASLAPGSSVEQGALIRKFAAFSKSDELPKF